jgi:hypothetical protein
MKSLTEDSWTARALAWLARSVLRHRRFYFYSQLVLFAASIFYTINYLQFDTSRNDLVGAKKKYHQNFLKFKKEFPQQDD